FGLTSDKIRELLPQGPSPDFNPDINPELSRSLNEALGLAADETFKQGFNYMYSYHLLLGILRQKESAAIDLLRQQNVSLDELEKATRASLRVDRDIHQS